MKIKSRFYLWVTILTVAIVTSAFLLSIVVSEQFKASALQKAIDVNANFISTQAEYSLSTSDFIPENFAEKDKTFTEFFTGVDTSEIIRLKVWATDGTIVFSDDKSIVGNNYFDNTSFQEALAGGMPAVIKPPVKEENISETGYGQLMEIYVPIEDDSGDIVGIIETYTSLDLVNAAIEETTNIIFTVTIISSMITSLAIVFVLGNLQRNLLNPLFGLRVATKRIASGDFEIKVKEEGDEEIKEFASEINDTAQKLIEQKDALVKSERLTAIGELAARLAHDLRNPLHVIRNTVTLVREDYPGNVDERVQKDFLRIDNAIKRMSHQIEGVLNFVTQSPLTLEDSSIKSIIKGVTKKVDIPKNVKVVMPESDIVVRCDKEKFEIVFENLFLNSIQAVGEEGKIEFKIQQKGDDAQIEIVDSGEGIPEENLSKIFNPLFTTKQKGTGLGLSSCKSIVERHGGTISVKNNPTTFSIKIPLRPMTIDDEELNTTKEIAVREKIK